MKRIIQSIATATAAFLIAISLNSCHELDVRTIVGSGNVKTETRTIQGNFEKVKSERGLDVFIEQGDAVSVVVEADDNLINAIETRLEGNTLVVTSEYNEYSNVSSKKVTVRIPKISGLEATSGSFLRSNSNIRSENLDLITSSGANMKVLVEADHLTAESSSGSVLEVAGKALDFDTASSSGSQIKAGDLLANEVSADASSGSHILVHPLVKLEGEASSGAAVRYNSDPKSFSKEESSGGSVSKQ